MKKYVAAIFFIGSGTLSHAQKETIIVNLDSIVKIVESQRNSVLNAIQQYEERNPAMPMDTSFDINMKTQSVLLVPFIKLDLLEEKQEKREISKIYFRGFLDSVDYIVAQALPSQKVYIYRTTEKGDPIYSVSYPAVQLPKIHFFSKMRSTGSKGLFIYFFDRDKYFQNVPVLYKNFNALFAENPDLEKSTDIFSAIEYKYGLFEKYKELVSQERKDDSLGIKPRAYLDHPDMGLIKEKLRTNLLALVKYKAVEDTSDLVNVFLSDITTFAGLSSNQTRLISRLIMNDLNPKSVSASMGAVRKNLNCYRQPYYNFLGMDISDYYLAILTKCQREQYEDHLRLLNYWLVVCENEIFKDIRRKIKLTESMEVKELLETAIRKMIE